jgi:quercetin dioxygenase-like cupin family protein
MYVKVRVPVVPESPTSQRVFFGGTGETGIRSPPMTERFNVVHPKNVPKDQFNTCETSVRKLTERLGATELRVNQVLVEPGEVTTPHTHDGQEEIFVALTAGQIALDGEVHDIPQSGVVRVHPDTERNLLNQTTDTTHVWLAFGAPPVGTIENFGSYVVSEDDQTD